MYRSEKYVFWAAAAVLALSFPSQAQEVIELEHVPPDDMIALIGALHPDDAADITPVQLGQRSLLVLHGSESEVHRVRLVVETYDAAGETPEAPPAPSNLPTRRPVRPTPPKASGPPEIPVVPDDLVVTIYVVAMDQVPAARLVPPALADVVAGLQEIEGFSDYALTNVYSLRQMEGSETSLSVLLHNDETSPRHSGTLTFSNRVRQRVFFDDGQPGVSIEISVGLSMPSTREADGGRVVVSTRNLGVEASLQLRFGEMALAGRLDIGEGAPSLVFITLRPVRGAS